MMRRVLAIARHLFGLFVDDGGLAVTILVWTAAVGASAFWLGVAPLWRGPLLFAGLALLLAWACLRVTPRRGS